ncbi:MAG: hypothetical protein EA427_10580 [Spirochaetaceae bacterium]|nr:MAG: hypothetical protein EA427_10580 [Spirochaetaceae bacterium]
MSDSRAIQAHLEPILEILQEYVLRDSEEALPRGFDGALEKALEEARFLQMDSVIAALESILDLAAGGRPDPQELLPPLFSLQDTLQAVPVDIPADATPAHDHPDQFLQWDGQSDQEEVLRLDEHQRFLLDGALSRGLTPYVLRITYSGFSTTVKALEDLLERELSLVKVISSESRQRLAALVVSSGELPLRAVLDQLPAEQTETLQFESRQIDAQAFQSTGDTDRPWYYDLPPLVIQLEAAALDRMRFYISRLQAIVNPRDQPLVRELAQTLESAVSVSLRNLVESLRTPLEEVAKGERKRVVLSYGGAVERIPAEIADVLREALQELLINAITHGIEAPAERAGAGKREQGSLHVFGSIENHVLTVRVVDDGKGLSSEEGLVVGGLRRIKKLLQQRLGGAVAVRSGERGTSATVTVPVAAGGWTGLLCMRESRPFVVPIVLIAAVVPVGAGEIVEEPSGGGFLRYRDRQVPLVEAHGSHPVEPVKAAVIVSMLSGDFAFALDGEPEEVSVIPDGMGTVEIPEKGLQQVTVAIQPGLGENE